MKFNLDKKARKSELSTKKRFKKYDDAILKELPDQKKQDKTKTNLKNKNRLDKEAFQNPKQKKEKVAEKKRITNQDEQRIKQIECNQFEPHLEKIKHMQDESTK